VTSARASVPGPAPRFRRASPKMNAAAHPEDEVFTSVCNLFGESQFHVSSHRKNIQALRKLHSKIATAAGLEGESVFLQAFCHCLHVLLNLKKNDETSSRLIRFLVGFIVRSAEAVANSTAPSNGVVERFIESLMSHVLDNIDSKEKLVRSRLCQVMVACLNSVQELR
jgi:condensin complex subunit 3